MCIRDSLNSIPRLAAVCVRPVQQRNLIFSASGESVFQLESGLSYESRRRRSVFWRGQRTQNNKMGFLNKLFGKDSPQQRPGVIDFRCYSKVGIESAFRISRVFVNKVAMDVFGLGPLSAAAEQACQYFSEPCHSEGRELFLTIFQQDVYKRQSGIRR